MTSSMLRWADGPRTWLAERAAALDARERAAAAGGAAILAALAGWTLVWQPVQQARQDTRDRIAALDRSIALARAAGPALGQTPRQAGDEAPATRITRTASEAGLSIRRLEPEGGGFAVSFDQVPFDVLIAWLTDLEAGDGLAATALDLERQTTPGVVSARIQLEARS